MADACLRMQNEYGADINVLLYCCWIAARTKSFDSAVFERAMSFSEIWAEQVVRPLRSARMRIKQIGCALNEIDTDACMSARENIKRVELETEKLQLETLESMVTGSETGAPDTLTENIGGYLNSYSELAGINLDEEAREICARIAAAAYPELALDQLWNDAIS